MKKSFCIFALGAVLITTIFCSLKISDAVNTTCELVSLNNDNNSIDYKIATVSDADKLSAIGTTNVKLSVVEGKLNLSDLSKQESWLISHQILERPYYYDGTTCTLNNYDYSDYCPKTLLYTILYKSYYGIEQSRGLVFKKAESLNNDTKSVKFTYAYTSNAWELYLKKLLDMGFITKDEFNSENGVKFLADYQKISELQTTEANVSWDNAMSAALSKEKGVLGYSATYNKKGVLKLKKPKYFNTEKMLTLEALQIIAQFMRSSEKDMSSLESSIVSYKYGINYINNVTDEERKDIEYLIAKGVLDFENPEEFLNLYGEFTYQDALNICYRVANPDARLDFSEITLTDSESFWMKNGYYANRITTKTGN